MYFATNKNVIKNPCEAKQNQLQPKHVYSFILQMNFIALFSQKARIDRERERRRKGLTERETSRKREEYLFILLLNLLQSCKHIQFFDDIEIIFYWVIASLCVCVSVHPHKICIGYNISDALSKRH